MADKYNQKWVREFFNQHATHCAMTIGQTTYWYDSEEWVLPMVEFRRHEAKHKEQWKRYGYIGFSTRWIYQLFKYGYKNAPLEIEARESEWGIT